ncbi:MAG: CbtB-domain containing protein [Silicimonas sp.]|nr:CbtB-domain containing protein [Silicimonas sp.]
MNATQTASIGATGRIQAVIFAALVGLGIVFAAGHLQAAALHGAAHDARHANGFPCH